MKKIQLGLLAAALATTTVFAQGNGNGGKQKDDSGTGDIYVHGKNPKEGGAPTAGGTAPLTPINNHGGPVMVTPTAYLIWYGNWNQGNGSDTPTGQALVRTFLSGLGGSPYFNINKTYSGPSGNVSLYATEAT